MKISLDWLSDFVAFTEPNPRKIAPILTEKAAEVDHVISTRDVYNTVVTGKLVDFRKIEGSDKLHQGQFDIGQKELVSVIFGRVFELQKGEIYPIGLPGTKLPTGIEVKKTKMLGVETAGMVCSEKELGITYTTEGLLRFPKNTPLGKPVLEVLETALQKVVVGRIIEIKKHPNADKLSLCTVDVGTGSGHLEIICGGSNLKKNAKVPVALVGADLWGGIKIKAANIRDVTSNGMICSTEELHVAPSQNKEIYLLPDDAPLGKSFFEYAIGGDTVLDIENTVITNRPDLFSHIGFAREVVACGLGRWRKGKDVAVQRLYEKKFPTIKMPLKITVPKNEKIVPRYLAVYLTGVDGTKDSPDWMKRRLESCGIRSLGAVVDITNYVMLEYGTPNHAFDTDRTGKKWNMRLAKPGETMETLDGVTRKLTTDTIVFENEKNGIFDLCGVMGGEVSGIASTTKNILLHFPVYDPVKIRRTTLQVGPRTDAAGIYEKSVPLYMAEQGLRRAVQLFLDIFPEAKVASELMDQRNRKEKERTISLESALVERIAGMKISPAEMTKTLENLGFAVKKSTANNFSVIVPPWRYKDILIPEDLAEEVVRIHGLDTVEAAAPEIKVRMFAPARHRVLEQSIARILVKNGFYEILTLAFLGPNLFQRCHIPLSDRIIRLKNPLSEDLALMRTHHLPRLLETAEKNIRHRNSFRIFESGNVFFLEKGKKVEEHRITGLLIAENFFAAKAVAEQICAEHDWKYRITSTPNPQLPATSSQSQAFIHPGRQATMQIGKIGQIDVWELHPQIAAEFDLPCPTTVFSLALAPLAQIPSQARKIAPLPKYQEIPFDFSVICDRKLPVADLTKDLKKLDSRISAYEVMEVYEGKDIPAGQKSVTLSCEFRAPDRTLTDEERDEVWKVILKELEKRGARFRFGGK